MEKMTVQTHPNRWEDVGVTQSLFHLPFLLLPFTSFPFRTKSRENWDDNGEWRTGVQESTPNAAIGIDRLSRYKHWKPVQSQVEGQRFLFGNFPVKFRFCFNAVPSTCIHTIYPFLIGKCHNNFSPIYVLGTISMTKYDCNASIISKLQLLCVIFLLGEIPWLKMNVAHSKQL